MNGFFARRLFSSRQRSLLLPRGRRDMSVLAAASGSERFEVEASFEGELDLLELTKQTQCLLNTSTVERHTSASPTHTAAEDHQKRVEERLEELTMDSVLKSVPYYTPLTSGVVPARQLLALLEFTIPEYVQGSTADSIGQEELYNILILLESRLIEFTAKECIYLSTVLRPLLKSSADQLIQVSMALILKGLYIHKNTLRRYHSLVAIKIIQRVCPEDAELRFLKRCLLDSALWRLVSSADSNQTYWTGIHVAGLVQDTLFFCWEDISDPVRLTCIVWLRKRTKLQHCFAQIIKANSPYHQHTSDYFKKAERHIKTTNTVVGFDRSLLLALVHGKKVIRQALPQRRAYENPHSPSGVLTEIKTLRNKEGESYISAVSRIHNGIVRLNTVADLMAVVDDVVDRLPLLVSPLLDAFIMVLHQQRRPLLQEDNEPQHILNVLHRLKSHGDILDMARCVLSLFSAFRASKEDTLKAREKYFMDQLAHLLLSAAQVALIPAVLEQFMMSRECALYRCPPLALTFVVRLLAIAPVAALREETIQKSIQLFLQSEKSKPMNERMNSSETTKLLSRVEAYVTQVDGLQHTQVLLDGIFGTAAHVNRLLPPSQLSEQEVANLEKLEQARLILLRTENEATIILHTVQHLHKSDVVSLSESGKRLLCISESETESLAEETQNFIRATIENSDGFRHFLDMIDRANAEAFTKMMLTFFKSIIKEFHTEVCLPSNAAQLEQLRRRMESELFSLSPPALDALLYYVFVPSLLCVVPEEGVATSSFRLHSVPSIALSDRTLLNTEIQRRFSEDAFHFLYEYDRILSSTEGKEGLAVHGGAPGSSLMEAWRAWVRRTTFCCASDLIQLCASKGSTPLPDVQLLLRAYAVLLTYYEAVPVSERDLLFPPSVHEAALACLLSLVYQRVDMQASLQITIEKNPHFLNALPTVLLRRLMVTYIVTRRQVPSFLKEALRRESA